MMNCKVGEMPFTYLGLLMSVEKITMKDFYQIIQRVEKRMKSWESGYLSYGAERLKLIHVCPVLQCMLWGSTFFLRVFIPKWILLEAYSTAKGWGRRKNTT